MNCQHVKINASAATGTQFARALDGTSSKPRMTPSSRTCSKSKREGGGERGSGVVVVGRGGGGEEGRGIEE